MIPTQRRYAVGAELLSATEAHFRLFAPSHTTVRVVVDDEATTMAAEGSGYFSAVAPARAGSRYGFRLVDDDRLYPDPASRWQPDGPEAPSAVVDLSSHTWSDAAWPGIALPSQVLYEMHIGTYTREGTWRAAIECLPRLRDLGVTTLQVMPIAEFAGRFGWGYDGVSWFAPMHTYGPPSHVQEFVDAAHALGLAVILDVVYNHLGPAGNFLARFSPHYFCTRYRNDWGDALNFDDAHSGALRELVLNNVAYWVREFHVDGFRLDATQQIVDTSAEHLLGAIARVARGTAGSRAVVVVAENEPQDARLLRPHDEDGYGLDGVFNEDFHHSCRVLLTGVREAYLGDYTGGSREWLASALSGFLFQGQYYAWQSAPRGTPALDRPAWQFVAFLENHDQVANCGRGLRLVDLTSPSWLRAMSALLLLGPWTPMLFQGQEWGSHEPFPYFVDHSHDLQAAVLKGRQQFVDQFTRLAAAAPLTLDDIGQPAFNAAHLDHMHTEAGERLWRMHRDLLALRRSDPVLDQTARRLTGTTLEDRAMVLRYAGTTPADDRLLVVNLSSDRDLARAAEPLLAPPRGCAWRVLWCSEDAQYGGGGIAVSTPPAHTIATGHATTVFAPEASP